MFRKVPVIEEETHSTKTQSFRFPETPSYENPIVAVESNIYGFFNFVLKDGTRSGQDVGKDPVEIKTIVDRPVRRIDIYSEEMLEVGWRANCIMLYDKHAQRLLDAGYDEEGDRLIHEMLEEDERIVGVVSRVLIERPAAHVDLQFIVAKK